MPDLYTKHEDHLVQRIMEERQKVVDLEQQRDELLEYKNKSYQILLKALYHNQGACSPIGQPIRELLGIGVYDHLTDEQVAIAKAGG